MDRLGTYAEAQAYHAESKMLSLLEIVTQLRAKCVSGLAACLQKTYMLTENGIFT